MLLMRLQELEMSVKPAIADGVVKFRDACTKRTRKFVKRIEENTEN